MLFDHAIPSGSEFISPTQEMQNLELNGPDETSTNTLVQDALTNIFHPRQSALRAADSRCRLDDLLRGMLDYAPTPTGSRFVASALYSAHSNGDEAVIELAKAWLDHLFLPILMMARAEQVSGYISDTTVDRNSLRGRAAARERYHCPFTGYIEKSYAERLAWEGRDMSDVPLHHMKLAYILPRSLKHLSNSPVSQCIEGSRNVYQVRFPQARYYLSCGAATAQATYISDDPAIEVPDPELLRIRGAFTRVLNGCDVVNNFEEVF
ncbi:hypothetical protein NP233_g4579 [Leucocoprinus birnbaumii]|uniref:Uncharacterized protein n=1 Tax=Leucocoprinus birnbaumii TaxID=56174 RepID=A0AAD5W0V8_9AGAR|nr:hypothetical protein NP233_g4579 [Leucocoprinus birnbaumii]